MACFKKRRPAAGNMGYCPLYVLQKIGSEHGQEMPDSEWFSAIVRLRARSRYFRFDTFMLLYIPLPFAFPSPASPVHPCASNLFRENGFQLARALDSADQNNFAPACFELSPFYNLAASRLIMKHQRKAESAARKVASFCSILNRNFKTDLRRIGKKNVPAGCCGNCFKSKV